MRAPLHYCYFPHLSAEHIEAATSSSKPIFWLTGALAVFGHELTCEQANAGCAATRARGHLGERTTNAQNEWESGSPAERSRCI
jgi:hypothetical protein